MTDVAPTPDPNVADGTVAPEPTPDPAPADTAPADAPSTPDVAPVVDPTPVDPASTESTSASSAAPEEATSTPVEDSAPESPTPSEAPEVTPAPTVLVPQDGPHDDAEKAAMVASGAIPGLTNDARHAIDGLETAVRAVEDWLIYAKDSIAKLKRL